MDCNTARFLLELQSPSGKDTPREDQEAIKAHLAGCPTCSQYFLNQTTFEEELRRAIPPISVPLGLRHRLVASLERHRNTWYHRFYYRVGGLAAGLLLLISLSTYLVMTYRVPVQYSFVHDTSERALQAKRDEINEWLIASGFAHLDAPPDFQYLLLSDFYLADLPGHNRKVPTLVFNRPDADGQTYFAKVYILDGNVFNWKALHPNTDLASGTSKAFLHPHPENQGISYLVIYTGPSLEPFLLPDRGGPLT